MVGSCQRATSDPVAAVRDRTICDQSWVRGVVQQAVKTDLLAFLLQEGFQQTRGGHRPVPTKIRTRCFLPKIHNTYVYAPAIVPDLGLFALRCMVW